MNFASDNVTGAAPAVLDALAAGAGGSVMPYGNDDLTARVEARFAEVFETDLAVFLVATGTAANALGLAQIIPPYGAVYCHEEAHIQVHEAGAPEFYGGGKVIPLPGDHAKLTGATVENAIAGASPPVHHVKPAAISISQITETGSLYAAEEIAAVSSVCRANGLKLHMDGARFANAVVAAGISPADMTWRAGVDVLSFGATKNGALAAEAVVFFDPATAEEFAYRRKRGGHLFSKMRFLSAQMDAYLKDDLWLSLAGHANRMASKLSAGLSPLAEVKILHPVDGNMIQAEMPQRIVAALQGAGFIFYAQDGSSRQRIRLVTAFDTVEADVDRFIAIAAAAQ